VVLLVWVAAIALFFNRWGKIRMLLPYQPDYKEQLKAAAAAAAVPACAPQLAHVPGQSCPQVSFKTQRINEKYKHIVQIKKKKN
jgi:hypothetical protein